MKTHRYLICIFIFTSFFVSSQTQKKSINQNKSIPDSINVKTGKAYSLAINFEYHKALTLILQCIKQADSIKNDSLLGKSYLTYGVISTYLGKEEQALVNQRKAVATFIKLKDYKNVGVAYNNIGWAYSLSNKNLDSTIFYYKKALNAFRKANDERRIAYVLNNLGAKYIESNEFDKAEAILKKSLNLYKKNTKTKNKNFSLSSTYASFCRLHLKKKELQKALQYGNLAEKLALKHQNKKVLIDVFKYKNEIFDIQGNYVKANEYLKKYHDKLKVVHKSEKSKITQEMAAKFEAKEQKNLLEKERLENDIKKDKLKKSKLIINSTIFLLIVAILVLFLLKKNNALKLENTELLLIKNTKLKKLQFNTELIFLKTQLQPHFFFNTLNNLYALIIEKSDSAKDVVLKLSELMKYTMYGTEKITVPIIDEINNIENYLELESLRYGKKASPSIKIEGEINNIYAPPLLFISFIENSFKHNDVSDNDFKLSITFKKLNSKYLFFETQNTLITSTKNIKRKTKGIGLKNVKRRLQLIYKDDYELSISTTNNIFCVNLKIPVSVQ